MRLDFYRCLRTNRKLIHYYYSLMKLLSPITVWEPPTMPVDGLNSFHANSKQTKVTLRLTVSQSVCLGVEPRLGLMTRYLFTV
jgi:hypothetical protein